MLLITLFGPYKYFQSFVNQVPLQPAAMSAPIAESQGSITMERPFLPWPELSSSTLASDPTAWELSPHPPELELLPDVSDTPYEIVQIVKRSLRKYEAKAPPPLEPNPSTGNTGIQEQNLHDTSSESEGSRSSDDYIWSSTPTSPITDGEASPSADFCKSHELKPKSSFLTPMLDRLTAKSIKIATATASRSAQAKDEKKKVVTTWVLSVGHIASLLILCIVNVSAVLTSFLPRK